MEIRKKKNCNTSNLIVKIDFKNNDWFF